MDANRFDTLLRSLATSPSRRSALRLLTGSALGGLFTFGTMSADAKKKGGGKKGGKKKKCKGKEKVTICHKGQTMQVSRCAVKGHERHGDTLGECQTQTPPPTCQPPCTGGKICQSNGSCACPANMSPCAADGSCVATELCCSENTDCPESNDGRLECEDGVCVCWRGRNAPCRRSNGDWYCCSASETCCNDDACCMATCTVQAGECTCPGGSGPCSDEFDGITYLSCCGAGDTCSSVDCFNTTCTAGNSTRGGPIAICGGASNQCRCATSLEANDSYVCVNYSLGVGCPAGCPETPCTGGQVCVDATPCGLPEGQDVMPSCVTPCT